MSEGIYVSDPDAAGDAEFTRGALHHLVVGNRGRMLDARRTPVSVTGVFAERGEFEVEVGAFEDAGARWALALSEVEHFQFASDAAIADPAVVGELERARAEFDRELVIEADPQLAAGTRQRVAAERARMDLPRVDVARHVRERRGDPELFGVLEQEMARRGVEELEQAFAERFVTNPRSGEMVKGHAIVLAELGLCPFVGRVVRDPALFSEPWTKERRAAHLVVRLAFMQALLGDGDVTLFRGAAVDGELQEPAPASLVSATFAREVAESHFEGGPTTRTAVLVRQEVPVSRVLMSFLETRAMNAQFLEAEAVLVGDPRNRAF